MKQTAVDYLVKELSAILGQLQTNPMQDLLMVDAINKAKQMEKQQMIEFAYSCSHPELSKEWIKKIYEQTYGVDAGDGKAD